MRDAEKNIQAAFLELLAEKPYHQITVNDIAERCGVHRNTFYYHYRDIPALLGEIAKGEIDALLHGKCSYDSIEGWLLPIVAYAREHRKLLLHIYRSLDRDILIRYVRELTTYAAGDYLRTATAGASIAEEDRELLARFFGAGLGGLALYWLDRGLEIDPTEAVGKIREILKLLPELEI